MADNKNENLIVSGNPLSSIGTKNITAEYTKSLENINKMLSSIGTRNMIAEYTKSLESINKTLSSIGTRNMIAEYTKSLESINKTLSSIGTKNMTAEYTKSLENINKMLSSMSSEGIASRYKEIFDSLNSTITEGIIPIIEDIRNVREENRNSKNTYIEDDSNYVSANIDEKFENIMESISIIDKKIERQYTRKDKIINFVLHIMSCVLIGMIFSFLGIDNLSLEEYFVEQGREFGNSILGYVSSFNEESRVQTIKSLSVYKSNRKDSEILGKLVAGQEVEIIEKKRNWTKVVYMDNHDNNFKIGWVLTRYLDK
ncbi:SH3 domain-containing protein [Vagococcus sp. CY53-2]|uniref:SH3 domain-containing protein n=1 Tax=Vagococcus sp. CY53-2 TaxID=2925780 RepID=UPI001F508FA4|nr:SH3 domain-containing protein [Vagococcus sp. CY53-2]MCI0130027.1 SH3 domain-containing protein [Vagococcus sp. CY53-2]